MLVFVQVNKIIFNVRKYSSYHRKCLPLQVISKRKLFSPPQLRHSLGYGSHDMMLLEITGKCRQFVL